MRELYYLVSAAAIATMVAAFAVPASAQPFSSVIGSWGYGGYGAFHMVLWVLIVIAFILGVVWRVWLGTRRNGGGVLGPAAAGRTNARLEALLRRAPSKARRTAVQSQSNATRGNDENGLRHQNKNYHKDTGRRELFVGTERVLVRSSRRSSTSAAKNDAGSRSRIRSP